ncbi:MAG: hypothetical protein OER83_05225 [Flavobacteriaceae bacterium]|nr:hypothetical protein [Flavobacteriaceae bacterium]MDH3796254.1 hypothetical protein [Flavobacteriaceae bacterium]
MKTISVIFILSFWITGLIVPSYFALTSEENAIHWALDKHEKEQKESEEKDSSEVEFIFPAALLVKLVALKDLNRTLDKEAIGISDFALEIVVPPPEFFA